MLTDFIEKILNGTNSKFENGTPKDNESRQRVYGDSMQLAISQILDDSNKMHIKPKNADGYIIMLSDIDLEYAIKKQRIKHIENNITISIKRYDYMTTILLNDSKSNHLMKYDMCSDVKENFRNIKKNICDYIKDSWIFSQDTKTYAHEQTGKNQQV